MKKIVQNELQAFLAVFFLCGTVEEEFLTFFKSESKMGWANRWILC